MLVINEAKRVRQEGRKVVMGEIKRRKNIKWNAKIVQCIL
jgi:hypothetical protein